MFGSEEKSHYWNIGSVTHLVCMRVLVFVGKLAQVMDFRCCSSMGSGNGVDYGNN